MKLTPRISLAFFLTLAFLVLCFLASNLADEFIRLIHELGGNSWILESVRYWWLMSAIPILGIYFEIKKNNDLSNKFYVAAIALIPILFIIFLWGAYSPVFSLEGRM